MNCILLQILKIIFIIPPIFINLQKKYIKLLIISILCMVPFKTYQG